MNKYDRVLCIVIGICLAVALWAGYLLAHEAWQMFGGK